MNIDVENIVCTEKPFSPLIQNNSTTLQELISQRAAEFTETTGYYKIDKELEDAIQAIKNGREKGALLLEASINTLWTAAFSAGYKAGMVDVMAAMTLNQADITAVKYIKR